MRTVVSAYAKNGCISKFEEEVDTTKMVGGAKKKIADRVNYERYAIWASEHVYVFALHLR